MVSIIMPAYNAEKYIAESIESILAQTYADWELIIIDDGSTDKTRLICEKYAAVEERICVIYQNNGGVSKARNKGLTKASGEWIAFVDADDVLPSKSLAIRSDLMEDAEMVIAGYELFNEDGIIEKMPKCSRTVMNQHDAVRNILATGEIGYQGYAWNKLFKREVIEKNHIDFDENISLNEDRLFCVSYAMCCRTVYLSDDLVYRYRISKENATSSVPGMTNKDRKKFMSEFAAFDRAMNIVKEQYPDIYYWGALEAQYRAVILKRKMNSSGNQFRQLLNQRIRNYGKIVLQAPPEIIGYRKKAFALGHMVLKR